MEQPLLLRHQPTYNPRNCPPESKVPGTCTSPDPATISTAAAVVRVVSFLAVLAVSLWANSEASKGFRITVLSAAGHTLAGHKFDLLFVSNGGAVRLILNSSAFIERSLFPNDAYPRKPVSQVTLYMAGHDLDAETKVCPGDSPGEFVVSLSPAVMATGGDTTSVASAVLVGMARVWLWDGNGRAPRPLVDAMVEYLVASSGHGAAAQPKQETKLHGSALEDSCWSSSDFAEVAGFLRYCGEKSEGFVARLNRAMKEDWDERTVNRALGMQSSAQLCSAYMLQGAEGLDQVALMQQKNAEDEEEKEEERRK